MNGNKKEEVPQREKRPEEWTEGDAMNRVLHAEYGSCQAGVSMSYLATLRNRVADWLDRINDAIYHHAARKDADAEAAWNHPELAQLVTDRIAQMKRQLEDQVGTRLKGLDEQLAKLVIELAAARNERADLERGVWLRITPIEGGLQRLDEYAHRVGGKVTVATGDHPSLRIRLERIEEKLDHEDDRISDVEVLVGTLRGEVSGLKSCELDRRLQVLEKDHLADRVEAFESTLRDHREAIANLNLRIQGLEKKLDDWRAGVDRALDQLSEAHP